MTSGAEPLIQITGYALTNIFIYPCRHIIARPAGFLSSSSKPLKLYAQRSSSLTDNPQPKPSVISCGVRNHVCNSPLIKAASLLPTTGLSSHSALLRPLQLTTEALSLKSILEASITHASPPQKGPVHGVGLGVLCFAALVYFHYHYRAGNP